MKNGQPDDGYVHVDLSQAVSSEAALQSAASIGLLCAAIIPAAHIPASEGQPDSSHDPVSTVAKNLNSASKKA